MPLKTWQYTLAFVLHTLAMSWFIFLLTPDQNKVGAGGWSHRKLLLALLVMYNVMMGIVVWAVSKRQVSFLSVAGNIVHVLVAADAVWKCVYVFLPLVLPLFPSCCLV